VIGPLDAPVKLVEFSDFQCPYCAQLKPRLRDILARHRGRVAILYRHFPLQRLHPYAFSAANASECAAVQGRFQEFHDVLYEDQAAIGHRPWRDFALSASVPDLSRFERCVADTAFAFRVRADEGLARSINLGGTPTIIVDGLELGGPTLAELEKQVEDAVRRARRR